MIRITRGKTRDGKFNPYKIYIDDVCRGEIRENETIELEVESGGHEVYAKIAWYRSNILCVDVNDSVIELEVGNNPSPTEGRDPGFGIFGLIILIVLTIIDIRHRKDYLFLIEKKWVDKPQRGGSTGTE